MHNPAFMGCLSHAMLCYVIFTGEYMDYEIAITVALISINVALLSIASRLKEIAAKMPRRER